MPIPAVNSIANQETVPYSGVESDGPSFTRPYREAISTITKTRKPVAEKM